MASPILRALPGALLCSLATGGLAAQAFEGVVTWQMHEKNQQMVQTYKGGMVRTEMGQGGRQAVMIMDAAGKKMTMIMPSEKMYMTMDLSQAGHQMPGMDHGPAKTPKITATGKTETIAGRSCEVYRYAEEEGKPDNMEMCVAKGLGYFMMGSGGGMGVMGRRDPMADVAGAASNPEYARLYKDGFFPLRVSKLEGGKAEQMMIVTKLEPKSVDASVFQVPAGYQEMKMPGMR